MINIQHTDIERRFGQSCIQVNKEYSRYLYSELLGHISLKALKCIKEEEVVKNASQDCTHKKRFTMDLSCSHEILPYISQSKPIPLWLIYRHWKHLTLHEIKKEGKEEINITNEINVIIKKFADSSYQQKKEIKRKLRKLVDLSSSQTVEPWYHCG